MDDHELAARLAVTAGKLLRDIAGDLLEGTALGKAGDAISNQWISRVLHQSRPDDGILSEEEVSDPERLAHRRVWVIDPLDGTREFSEGRIDWAVHVALAIDGQPVAAAVALPALDLVLATWDRPHLQPAPAGALRILVSRTRCPQVAVRVGERLGAELVAAGSAGYKTMAVVRGEAHAYLHAGGQYEWDSAAPAGVALSAGLHVSRLDGSAMRYNQPDPYLPDLLVCRPELADEFLSAIAAAGDGDLS